MSNAAQLAPDEEIDLRTPYELIGGAEKVRALVNRFYDIMEKEPAAQGIRAMHGPDLSQARERLYLFMSGWLGGPPLFPQARPGVCIRSAHAGFPIGEAERDAWLTCMYRALEETGVSDETRALLKMPLFKIADLFRSR